MGKVPATCLRSATKCVFRLSTGVCVGGGFGLCESEGAQGPHVATASLGISVETGMGVQELYVLGGKFSLNMKNGVVEELLLRRHLPLGLSLGLLLFFTGSCWCPWSSGLGDWERSRGSPGQTKQR